MNENIGKYIENYTMKDRGQVQSKDREKINKLEEQFKIPHALCNAGTAVILNNSIRREFFGPSAWSTFCLQNKYINLIIKIYFEIDRQFGNFIKFGLLQQSLQVNSVFWVNPTNCVY